MSKPIKRYTVSLPIRGNQVCLGMKLRGFGEGKWNGFGGKVEPGETHEAAARREIKEETGGMTAKVIEEIGIITFDIEGKDHRLEVHFFRVTDWVGEPTQTDEMRPEWFATDSIPYGEMWAEDKLWLPLLLAGKKFQGSCYYESDEHTIKSHTIQEVAVLEPAAM